MSELSKKKDKYCSVACEWKTPDADCQNTETSNSPISELNADVESWTTENSL